MVHIWADMYGSSPGISGTKDDKESLILVWISDLYSVSNTVTVAFSLLSFDIFILLSAKYMMDGEIDE